MPNAATNAVALRLAQETTPGVAPTASGAFQVYRYTSASLAQQVATTMSDEIRSDRTAIDVVQTGLAVGGDVAVELSHATHEALLAGALWNTWTRPPQNPVPAANGGFVNNTNPLGVTASTGVYGIFNGTGGAYAAGHLVRITGYTTAANNGVFRVTAATSNSLTTTNTGSQTEAATAQGVSRIRVIGFEAPATGDIQATANGLSTATLSFTGLGIVPGMWLWIGGAATVNRFATTANNRIARVGTVTATTITWDRTPPGWTADTASGRSIRVFLPERLVNGNTASTYSIERSYTDIGQHEVFTGLRVAGVRFDLAARSIARATFTLQGTGASVSNTQTSVSPRAATTSDVWNTTANVGSVWEGTVALAGAGATSENYVTSLSLSVTNNLRELNGLAQGAPATMNPGRFEPSGTLSVFFADTSLYQKILATSATSIAATVRDTTTGTGLVLDLPRIKYTSGAPTVAGSNQDVTLEPAFMALLDPTLGYAMSLQQFDTGGA